MKIGDVVRHKANSDIKYVILDIRPVIKYEREVEVVICSTIRKGKRRIEEILKFELYYLYEN